MRIGEKLYHIRFGMWRGVIGTGNGRPDSEGFGNNLCGPHYMPMPRVRYNGIWLRETWLIPNQLLSIFSLGRLPRPGPPDRAARPGRSAH